MSCHLEPKRYKANRNRVVTRPRLSTVIYRKPKKPAVLAAVPDYASGTLAIVGSLGIVGGTLFAALYLLERQSKEALVRKIERLQLEVKARDRQLEVASKEVARAKEYARENDMFRTRYADASRDILKLERALELKDGQLESFMVVAQRQIAYLESQMRELQKPE